MTALVFGLILSAYSPQLSSSLISPPSASVAPSWAPLIDSVKSAVVNLDIESRGTKKPEALKQGLGSGFLIDPNGLILTNNHVVAGASNIRVKLSDGRQFDAMVMGRDPLVDLAVIKLKGPVHDLPAAKLGNSDKMRVGDWVIAIGNPFGLASSVSLGIISARARDIKVGPYDEFLQTDAAINPGNSGGPLFNAVGEVIGINTAIIGGSSGIGFAVPSNLARALIPQLKQDGFVTRAWLGVAVEDLTADLAKALDVPTVEGAVVMDVAPGSPALLAGIRNDDVIVNVGKEKISSGGMLTRTVSHRKPGGRLSVALYRAGIRRDFVVELGVRPDLEGNRLAQGGSEPMVTSEEARRRQFGLVLQDSPAGPVIVTLVPASLAEQAHLEPGMVIVEVNKKTAGSTQAFWTEVFRTPAGKPLLLRVQVQSGARLLRAIKLP